MYFKYTALNRESNKLMGTIEAENEEQAREILHKMGVSVIIIESLSPEEKEAKAVTKTAKILDGYKPDQPIVSYYFQAIDPSGKKIDGTIDSFNRFSAYRRLTEEYKFQVKEIYLVNLSEEEKRQAQEEGIAELKQQLTKIKEDESAKNAKKVLGFATVQEKTNSELTAEEEALLNVKSEQLQKSVDRLLNIGNEILNKYSTNLPPEFIDKTRNIIDKLAVLKVSNNFSHIRKLSKDLISLIEPREVSHPLFKVKNQINDFVIEEISKESEENRKLFHDMSRTTDALSMLANTLEEVLSSIEKNKGMIKDKTVETIRSYWSFLGRREPSAELKNLLFLKKKARSQLLNLWKAYLFSGSREVKKDIRIEISSAWKKYREILNIIAVFKNERKKDYAVFWSQLKTVVTWLMVFYIVYFFIASLLLHKQTDFNLDFFKNTLSSHFVIYFVIILFVLEGVLTLKLNYFKKSFWPSLFLMLIWVSLSGIVVINF